MTELSRNTVAVPRTGVGREYRPAIGSNSIVPVEPSPFVYEIASLPTLKPKVRAPPSCSRNRVSTDDAGSGQAMRVPATSPTFISPGVAPPSTPAE